MREYSASCPITRVAAAAVQRLCVGGIAWSRREGAPLRKRNVLIANGAGRGGAAWTPKRLVSVLTGDGAGKVDWVLGVRLG